MAKCELSSTLKNLKFMQRAKAKEEKKAAEEEAVLQVDGAFGSSASIKRKCIVVMEGDPHPGVVKGRMSFQSFNPSIDKLNQEASDSCIPQTSMSTPENQNNGISDRLEDPHATSPKNNFDTDLKRKQPEIDPHVQSPHRSKSIYIEGDGQPSQEKKRKPYLGKEKKQEKWDWNVLRRAKVEKQKGLNMPH